MDSSYISSCLLTFLHRVYSVRKLRSNFTVNVFSVNKKKFTKKRSQLERRGCWRRLFRLMGLIKGHPRQPLHFSPSFIYFTYSYRVQHLNRSAYLFHKLIF